MSIGDMLYIVAVTIATRWYLSVSGQALVSIGKMLFM